VVSDDLFNRRHGLGAGLCLVVPCSATTPKLVDASVVRLLMTNYRALTRDVWIKCALMTSVSHARLERPRRGGHYVSEWVSRTDMALIEAALLAVQKLA
jgi:uncharacterized protein YifN (PemK superfamily)